MHGYGEFLWNEGKKFYGFYKNDKKDGFGIYYWPNNKFYIGFWKYGKQNGIGKYIKDNSVKYGDGKMVKKKIQSLLKKNFLIASIHLKQTLLIFFSGRKKELKIL